MARQNNHRTAPRRASVFIAVEGRNTEHEYFQRLSEMDSVNEHFDIAIYPEINQLDERVVTDPIGLVKTAASKGRGYDHRWAVMDHDGHAKLDEAFQLAQKEKVSIAFSHIAFEIWLLLHFEQCATPFARAECKDGTAQRKSMLCGSAVAQTGHCAGNTCVAGYLRCRNWLPDYGKSRRTARSVAETILQEPLLTHAVKNAAWIRSLQVLDGRPRARKHNPYTDVDQLVKLLLCRGEVFHWGRLDHSYRIPGIAALTVSGGPDRPTVRYANLGSKQAVLNASNFPEHFSCSVGNGRHIPIAFPSRTFLIAPGHEVEFFLGLPTIVEPGALLSFANGQHRLLIPLN